VIRWIGDDDTAEWAALFRSYERSAYRLEGQQVYSSPAEDAYLAKFLAGEPIELDLSNRRERMRLDAATGRTKTIVRIVVEPPTPYTRLELAVYPQMARTGDDIRIIAVPQGGRPSELPLYDYWLFDEREVWRMHYYENFRFAGAELLDGADVVAEHLRMRDFALSRAVPLDEYLASREADTPESTTV
jgi:hypothetical protein